jgi:hypothetical protein
LRQALDAGLQVGLETLSGPAPTEYGVVSAREPHSIEIRNDRHRRGDQSGGTRREPGVQENGSRCHVLVSVGVDIDIPETDDCVSEIRLHDLGNL